jgi:phytoene synthase
VVDTALRWEIPAEHFEAFLHSMAMDLTVDHYDTYEDLYEYVFGSAAVIGLQMIPILEPAHPAAAAHAESLGVAFQLANFIRDVDEDLDRGRIYLPLAELAEFGVTPQDLARRRLTPQIRAALQGQIARVRRLERAARPGIAMLHPATRDCIDTARILYCGIVDAVEAIDYDVFAERAAVPMSRRLRVASAGAARALVARRRYGPGTVPGPVPARLAAG